MEFTFHDDFSVPLFTPNPLSIERIEEGQYVDQWVEGAHNVNDEMVGENINLDDEEDDEWDDERSYRSEDDEDDEVYCEGDYSDADGDDILAALDSEFVQAEQGNFVVGMTFADAKEAREAINLYGVKFRYKLKFEKNEPTRLRVRCINDANCPFKLLVSKDGDNGGLAVKTAYMDHSCFIQREVPSMSQGFLANFFKNTIYKNPKFTAESMQCEIKKHLKLHVSEHKCKRAKKKIQELNGSFRQEFAILGAYVQMVKESNPGSKCEVQLSEDGLENRNTIFKRIFVLMDACRMNWMQGCRPVISVDGCLLKGVTNGMLLTAVGKDANDQIEKSQTSTSRGPQKMLPRRQIQKNTMCGIGVHVNLSSGQTTINPGFASQRVIIEGERSTPRYSDPTIRGPIPNGRVIKRNLRHIYLSGEGSEVRRPGALTFKPPGLQWNGSPCVTSNQLLQQRDTRKCHKEKYGETQGISSTIID